MATDDDDLRPLAEDDETEMKYTVHEFEETHELWLSPPPKHYDDFSEAERDVHHGLNKALGKHEINRPPELGEFFGIVLRPEFNEHFEVGESYTLDEIVGVVKDAIDEIREVFQGLNGILTGETPTGRLTLAIEYGELELADIPYIDEDSQPFTFFLNREDVPDDLDAYGRGSDVVFSVDGDVIYSGMVAEYDTVTVSGGKVVNSEYDTTTVSGGEAVSYECMVDITAE